ncbi:MAG: Structural maintenance of chromosomes protein 5 [Pycnora praestabilis]|nr:MAG: Structural maintenance of chromosomes protein 5 [Pycnora praestabilis]
MPSLTVPHRRRRAIESDEENSEDLSGSVTSTSQRSTLSKRARYNDNLPEASNSPLLPNGYLAERNGASDSKSAVGGRSMEKHHPGSIVRVKLTNFVTYTSAEFFPGPSLNMVIGPNGTGKSTLVCAICLGLGWGPQHLGRAKDVSEYVKHGCQEATIEIELAGDHQRHGKNPVIRRTVKREGNKSQFYIDGKSSTQKGVLELARSFSIQIDNLCQFLPQDKVCEFAALTPVELLNSTQRAAAPEEMIEWHGILKTLRAEQQRVLAHQGSDKETLANLEGRQNLQRADVERLRERANIQERVNMLEQARPFAKYRQARLRHLDAKKRKKDAQVTLKQLEDDVEPSLRAVNAKQDYRAQIERVLKDRTRVTETAEVAADDLVKEQKDLEDHIDDLKKELQAEKNGDKKRRQELPRIEGNITRLKKQMEEEPIELDVAFYNEQIREKGRLKRDVEVKVRELNEKQKSLVSQVQEKNSRINQAERDLENLASQAGQQSNKLKHISSDTSRAWDWVREHQDIFEKPIYGPPIVECSVKDPKYVDAIESLFQRNDLLAFTCQTRGDFKKLQQQFYGTMRLAEITIRTISSGLSQFRTPVSEEDMRKYGFEGWALDYIAGPEPVLAMLCSECRVNQTGVVLRDITEQQYAALENSPISSWVTGNYTYQITRRREYGPGATSTRVRDLKKAQVWTSQPVDTSAKRDLQENTQGWGEEVDEYKRQHEDARNEVQAIREEYKQIVNDKVCEPGGAIYVRVCGASTKERNQETLEAEKAAKQKAIGEFRALPTKLAQQEEKLVSIQQAGAEVKRRIMAILDKQTDLTLKKGQLALYYADAVEVLRIAHFDLLHVESIQIEATSELETLTERNRAVKDMLEAKRREADEIARETDSISKVAKRLLEECKEVLAGNENKDEQRTFFDTLPENQTPEDLEIEIESEKARLELVHEGNPRAIQEFEERQKKIDRLMERVGEVEQKLADLEHGITEVREKWEPELDKLVKNISDAFSHSFSKIGCAGQVGVHKDEDFDQWSIQIQVKFRENESLSILDSHRQSGGERAVSTIFYLMALQSLARAPFRVVDEINQGMDPRNERMVHERMVNIACQEHTSQYFLITPKLLHGLKYHPRMKIQCIASGEYMPRDYKELDFGRCVDIMRGVKAAG